MATKTSGRKTKATRAKTKPTGPVVGTEPARTATGQDDAPAAPATAAKLCALDAAGKGLQEEGKAMGCQELVGLMAGKGYWSSPGGKTPAATLYSAITREIALKGGRSRFRKAGRGTFALSDLA